MSGQFIWDVQLRRAFLACLTIQVTASGELTQFVGPNGIWAKGMRWIVLPSVSDTRIVQAAHNSPSMPALKHQLTHHPRRVRHSIGVVPKLGPIRVADMVGIVEVEIISGHIAS
jgi:hypothetical protein